MIVNIIFKIVSVWTESLKLKYILYHLLKNDISYRIRAGEEKEVVGGEEGGVYGEQPAGERQKESESHWLVFIMGLLCHSTAEKQSQLNLRMRYLLFSNNLNNNYLCFKWTQYRILWKLNSL